MVIITDKRNTGDNRRTKDLALSLAKGDVEIITVAIGDRPDVQNLKKIIPKIGNVFNTTRETDSPSMIAEQIMEKARDKGI